MKDTESRIPSDKMSNNAHIQTLLAHSEELIRQSRTFQDKSSLERLDILNKQSDYIIAHINKLTHPA